MFARQRERVDALVRVMGRRFLAQTALITHLCKGFVFGGGQEGLVGTPLQFLLRGYGTLDASRIQVLRTIAVSPWALKPLFGMLSDTLVLGGYNKLPLVLCSTGAAVVACLVLALLGPLTPTVVTLLLLVLFTQVAVADLLIEAKYTQKMVGHDAVGPTLTSFNSLGLAAGQFFSILLCGLLLSYVQHLPYLYLLPVPIFVGLLWPTYENWMDDEEYVAPTAGRSAPTMDASGALVAAPPARNRLLGLCGPALWYETRAGAQVPVCGLDTEKVAQHWRVFLLCCVICAVSLLTSLIGLLGWPTVWLFVASLLSACAMVGAMFALLDDRRVALIQTYVVLASVCQVSTGSADFFFYTDSVAQYAAGPHFSTFFYVTVMGVVGTALHICGGLIYYFCMTHWRFHTILRFANLVLIVLSVPQIFLVLRWNLALGVPDWLFVLGLEAAQTVTSAWAGMPITLMVLHLCPPGIEATSFALLAGSANTGRALSQYTGAYLLEAFAVAPRGAVGEDAQFANLWKVYLIGVFLPVIPLLLIPALIPDRRQTDSVLAEERV